MAAAETVVWVLIGFIISAIIGFILVLVFIMLPPLFIRKKHKDDIVIELLNHSDDPELGILKFSEDFDVINSDINDARKEKHRNLWLRSQKTITEELIERHKMREQVLTTYTKIVKDAQNEAKKRKEEHEKMQQKLQKDIAKYEEKASSLLNQIRILEEKIENIEIESNNLNDAINDQEKQNEQEKASILSQINDTIKSLELLKSQTESLGYEGEKNHNFTSIVPLEEKNLNIQIKQIENTEPKDISTSVHVESNGSDPTVQTIKKNKFLSILEQFSNTILPPEIDVVEMEMPQEGQLLNAISQNMQSYNANSDYIVNSRETMQIALQKRKEPKTKYKKPKKGTTAFLMTEKLKSAPWNNDLQP